MRASFLLVGLVALAVPTACINRPFVCANNGQCRYEGQQGTCEADRRCSFPDPACPSGRRYADYGTDGACVGKAAPCGAVGEACCAKDACQAGLACSGGRCVCTVTAASGGDGHTCIALAHGKVMCWGQNTSGQLGDGTLLSRAAPAEVPGLPTASSVVAREAHSCALLADGGVSCWGQNTRGQLGDGTATSRMGPVAVARLPTLGRAIELVAGARHACARLEGGEVACWGDNNRGQLGDGKTIERPLPELVPGLQGVLGLAAGDELSCAINADRRVWCWGDNVRKQIDGSGDPFVPTPRPVGVTDAVELAAGASHVCARTMDGHVTCWGSNGAGQIGRGESATTLAPGFVAMLDRATALAAGDEFSCVVASGNVACWGDNDWAQLGRTPPEGSRVPVAVPLMGASALAAGSRHACARLADGGVACWGDRARGQLGDGYALLQPMPTKVSLDAPVVELGAGLAHTCARLADGKVACWGETGSSRLGPRDRSAPFEPAVLGGSVADVVQLAVGADFTCARKSDGAVVCWGRGDLGQLADDTKRSSQNPVAIPLGEAATDLAAGGGHACAVLASARVACWGSNRRGQAGNPAAMADLQPKPFVVPTVAGAVQVGLGSNHSCVLLQSGTVSCWGAGDQGQLGPDERAGGASVVPIVDVIGAVELSAAGNHTCARIEGGAVRCWGQGSAGQLGTGVLLERNPRPAEVRDLTGPTTTIATGTFVSCAVVGGQVACWGLNRNGEVGDGTRDLRATATKVHGLPASPAVHIAAGESHVCAAFADGSAACWGRNTSGELGISIPTFRAAPMNVPLACRAPAAP